VLQPKRVHYRQGDKIITVRLRSTRRERPDFCNSKRPVKAFQAPTGSLLKLVAGARFGAIQ
jgi:hypothetical protein